jgi:uncharacterized peroxidase-related enzyme
MSRLKTVEIEQTTGKVKRILESYQSNLGMVPNVFKGMANSPITLQATVTLDRLIGEGTLTSVEQEVVKLVVAQYHDCEYCLAVHTAVGAHRGMSAQQMLDIRRGKTDHARHQALLQFTRRILETNGLVADSDLATLRAKGYTDEQIAEVVTIIGATTLGCYYNRLNQTELDFPKAPEI